MDGVLVVDKPERLTSHDVVAAVRRALGERRIGHTGTLDPLATGALALACGRATRLVRFLTASTKDYDATIRFGFTTNTYDITGEETGRSGRAPEREWVERALASLSGDYLQMPPAYSAKKVGGKRAYELARRDAPVVLAPAPVSVTRADLLAFDGATARVALTCSAGFYVRSFAQSLGELVGTGACLEALRRTRTGEFSLEQAIPLEQIVNEPAAARNRAVALDRLLGAFPAVALTPDESRRVAHGQDVDRVSTGIAPWTRLLDADGCLVALATAGRRPDSLHPVVVLI
jgi:tRNA pseudouridine55 synthase